MGMFQAKMFQVSYVDENSLIYVWVNDETSMGWFPIEQGLIPTLVTRDDALSLARDIISLDGLRSVTIRV